MAESAAQPSDEGLAAQQAENGSGIQPADEGSATQLVDESSASQQNEVEIKEDSSNIPYKFTRLKKSQRRRYNRLRKNGHSPEVSLKHCKDANSELLPTSSSATKNPIKEKDGKVVKTPYKVPSTAIKVGIVPVNYPNTLLTTEQLTRIRTKLSMQIVTDKDGPGPKFHKMSFRPSYMVFFCVDEATALWVKKQEPALHIPEANVSVVRENGFPALRIIMGYFPDSKALSTEQICEAISKQNNIPSQTWKALTCGSVITEKFSKLSFSIDESSFIALNSKNFVISYLLGEVKLQLVKVKKYKLKQFFSLEEAIADLTNFHAVFDLEDVLYDTDYSDRSDDMPTYDSDGDLSL